MTRDYDRSRRRLNRRADDAMDDARFAAGSFREALQPRGCVVAILYAFAMTAIGAFIVTRL